MPATARSGVTYKRMTWQQANSKSYPLPVHPSCHQRTVWPHYERFLYPSVDVELNNLLRVPCALHQYLLFSYFLHGFTVTRNDPAKDNPDSFPPTDIGLVLHVPGVIHYNDAKI